MFTITDPCYAADMGPEWEAIRQQILKGLQEDKPITEINTPLGKAEVLRTGGDGNFFGCCVDTGCLLVIPGHHTLPECAYAAQVSQEDIDSIKSGAIQEQQAFLALLSDEALLSDDALDL